jgi:hypothetical protein
MPGPFVVGAYDGNMMYGCERLVHEVKLQMLYPIRQGIPDLLLMQKFFRVFADNMHPVLAFGFARPINGKSCFVKWIERLVIIAIQWAGSIYMIALELGLFS